VLSHAVPFSRGSWMADRSSSRAPFNLLGQYLAFLVAGWCDHVASGMYSRELSDATDAPTRSVLETVATQLIAR